MIRTIAGYHADEEDDWVAELSCHHNQDFRHPPVESWEWVLDPDGRAAHLGTDTDCALCDGAELPPGLVAHVVLGPWDEADVPEGLQRVHRTPVGRWGCLRVIQGTIDFQFRPDGDPPGEVRHLEAPAEQAIPPDVTHQVTLLGPVRLQLELLAPAS